MIFVIVFIQFWIYFWLFVFFYSPLLVSFWLLPIWMISLESILASSLKGQFTAHQPWSLSQKTSEGSELAPDGLFPPGLVECHTITVFYLSSLSKFYCGSAVTWASSSTTFYISEALGGSGGGVERSPNEKPWISLYSPAAGGWWGGAE